LDPIQRELVGLVTDGNAEDEATAGHYVEHRHVLGEPHRMVEGRDDDVGPERQARRTRREAGEDGERRGPGMGGEGVMLLHPHRVEAELRGAGHFLQRLPVVVAAFDGNEADLECHGLSSKSLGYHRALTPPDVDGYVPRCLAAFVTGSPLHWPSSPPSSCTARSSAVWPCRRGSG